jgi:zinc transport system ATP-binding protein
VTTVVRLVDAEFGYRGVVALHASLSVESGEVVALLGPNGSGKSTLVKGMLGLADRYGGDVEWFGQPFRSWSERWRVGYVPQRPLSASPVPATVEEIVRSGRVARHGVLGRYGADDRNAVAAAIATVGLADLHRERIDRLSGGQQRRTLVARGLVGDAEVLVLDEPFAGVDADTQDALADTFRHLASRGVTLIVVLHELGPLDGVVTRAVQLDAGNVVYDGPAAGRPAEHDADHADIHGEVDDHLAGIGLLRPR